MPSIPAPARAVSTNSNAASPFVSRISTAWSAVIVRALLSSASATRHTCQPEGANPESLARTSTISGVRQRTNAMEPASTFPRTLPKAPPRIVACSSSHGISILRRALEARDQALHGFGVVDADEQPEVSQTPFQSGAIEPQEVVRYRHPLWGCIDPEPVAILETLDELFERQRSKGRFGAAW